MKEPEAEATDVLQVVIALYSMTWALITFASPPAGPYAPTIGGLSGLLLLGVIVPMVIEFADYIDDYRSARDPRALVRTALGYRWHAQTLPHRTRFGDGFEDGGVHDYDYDANVCTNYAYTKAVKELRGNLCNQLDDAPSWKW